MEYVKARRRLRLRNTYLVALRRHKARLRSIYPHLRGGLIPETETRPSLRPILFYAKQSVGCRCSKKTAGRPKVGRGACWGFQRSSVYARRSTRLTERAVVVGVIDPEDVLPPWGFHGELRRS